MADYDPLIPQPNENLSVSQQEILDNFTQIGALFGSNAAADHFAFNDATTAKRALHRRITFYEPLGSDPAVAGTTSYVYPKADTNDTGSNTQLYFRNILGITQLTSRFNNISATNGYYTLPGGLICFWGTAPASSFTNAFTGSFCDITFPTMANYTGAPVGFPNALFNIQVSIAHDSLNTNKQVHIDNTAVPPSQTGFRILVNAAKIDFGYVYWVAIGN